MEKEYSGQNFVLGNEVFLEIMGVDDLKKVWY
jgi:hypothetical protein